MTHLSIVDEVPARILCQGPNGGCAACCGVWNFKNRDDESMRVRLARRTKLVGDAHFDREKLAAARDVLLAEEKPHILSDEIPVCPFAGFLNGVDDDGTQFSASTSSVRPPENERIGCLIHPSRHVDGADLRDLAVYPKEVCAGHFCAPHQWLSDVEKDVAACATGLHYGLVVTDAGFVKAVVKHLEDTLHRRVDSVFVRAHADVFTALFERLRQWPHRDPDPRRFGGFYLDDGAIERTVTHGSAALQKGARATILDALGTKIATDDDATRALAALDAIFDEICATFVKDAVTNI